MIAATAASDSVIETAARGAEQFVQSFYYKIYDTARHDVFRFYKEPSVVVWNGTAYRGLAYLSEFFKNLPPTVHHISLIDAQPIPTGAGQTMGAGGMVTREVAMTSGANTPSSILVSVCGSVSYGGAAPRTFCQMFILSQDVGGPGHLFVSYDNFRLTS